MNKMGDFLFKHFEKIMLVMIALYFTGLWYQSSIESELRARCEAAGGVHVGQGHCVSREAVIRV